MCKEDSNECVVPSLYLAQMLGEHTVQVQQKVFFLYVLTSEIFAL